MRISYVITRGDSIGGAQIHVRDLATRFAAAGNDVSVVMGQGGVLETQLREAGIATSLVPALDRAFHPTRELRAVRELTSVLRRDRPDLVSTHSSKAGWLGRIAARRLAVPCLFTAHGWAFTDGVPTPRRIAYAALEQAVLPLAARVITVSEHDEVLARRWLRTRRDPFVTVHNGVNDIDTRLFADPTRTPPRIVFVGRFQEQKDHQLLLRALANLDSLEWTIDFVGAGPLEATVRRAVAGAGLAHRVQFCGQRTDVEHILAGAQLFVLASKWEGFPRSILEAMRAGLPVIASDVGGVREAVLDGTTGMLVAPGDLPSLEKALEHLLTSADARTRMGRAGRMRFTSEFTLERCIAATRTVYEDVLRSERR